MAYTPPASNAVNLDISGPAYTPPASNAVDIEIPLITGSVTVSVEPFENTTVLEPVLVSFIMYPELESTTDLGADMLWYYPLVALESTTDLDAMASLFISVPDFESTTTFTATNTRRVLLVDLDSFGSLVVEFIAEVPEGTDAVGCPPFENYNTLEKAYLLHGLATEFNSTTELAPPVVAENDAAVIFAEPFENNSVLESDLAPLVSVPDLENLNDLGILAIVSMPAGDLYLSCPPFENINVLEKPILQVGADIPDFEQPTDLVVDSIYGGILVVAPDFEQPTDLNSSTFLAIVLAEFEGATDLGADITPVVNTPDFEGTTGLEVEMADGQFVTLEPFISQTTFEIQIPVALDIPDFEQPTDLETVIEAFIALPEMNTTTALSVGDIYTFSLDDLKFYYILTITGAANGVEDVEIPFVSFQSRRRSGADTYLQVVIPSTEFIDDIVERESGTMRVDQAYIFDGDILQREAIIETTMDQVNPYQGGNSDSLILIGYTTTTYTPKTVEVYNGTYRAQIDGKLSYRLPTSDIFLNPGDTVIIGDDEFVLGVMSYTVSGTFQQIDLTEA